MPIIDTSSRDNSLNPAEELIVPAKLNIHFPIRAQLFNWCLEINAGLSTIANNDINFRADSFHVPHITLYMGFAETIENVARVLTETAKFAAALSPFAINVGKPYLKEPTRNWVFMDVFPAKEIVALKKSLRQHLDGYLAPLDWDVVAETPHITVGHISETIDEIAALLKHFENGMTGTAEAIEVSFCGARGTCLGSIRTFEINAT